MPTSFRARIATRLDRVQGGNIGDSKGFGGGIHEMRFHFGPGYRVYYAMDGKEIIVLFAGSAKSRQDQTIEQVRGYWDDYKQRKHTQG